MEETPGTLIEAVRYFSDLDVCHAYLRKTRWPRGIVCPHCDGKRVDEVRRRRLLCKDCRKEFSDKVGTIFVGLNLNNGNYGFCAMTFLFWLPSFTYIMFTNFALIEKEWRL